MKVKLFRLGLRFDRYNTGLLYSIISSFFGKQVDPEDLLVGFDEDETATPEAVPDEDETPEQQLRRISAAAYPKVLEKIAKLKAVMQGRSFDKQ